MNVLKNTNKKKKFILVIVFLILFSFCCPIKSNANDFTLRLQYGVISIFYGIEDGIMKLANSIFVDEDLRKSNDTIYLTPEAIIKGKFALMNANIFEEVTANGDYYDIYGNKNNSSIVTGKNQLRTTISAWYYALRNLAIVGLLSVLVYVGIRMVISSASQDKAKYKMMLKDWFVSLCMVFAMHYIMVGVLNLSSTVTKAIGTNGDSISMTQEQRESIENDLAEMDERISGWTDETDVEEGKEYFEDAFGRLFVYAAIIVFTGIFLVKYIMRAITIVFLVLIAPITCITYAIDKIKDGKAQAFDFWFREFFFQVIIQPFHLLIYVVLIGSASALASSNIIYCILCYAMMLPAEKIIKQMFGINDKLGSPLGAFASGAVANNLMNKATHALNSRNNKTNKNGGNSGGESSGEDGLPPRTREGSNLGAYDDGNISDSSEPDEGQQQLNTNDNPQLEENNNSNNIDNTGPGSSAADAYGRNPNLDPVREAEKEALEEQIADGQINEDELTPEQRNLLGMDEQPENNGEADNNVRQQGTSEETNQQENNRPSGNNRQEDEIKKPSRARLVGRAIKDQAARDIRKKYGTTKFWKVAGKMAAKGAGFATKATLAAGAGALAGGFALATGNPKAVAAAVTAGAALGNSAGKRINGISSSIGRNGGRYVKAARSAYTGKESVRKQAKNTYIQNQKERDYVEQRLADKNGGIQPSRREIDAEMEQRWSLRESGITNNDIIDSTLDMAEDKKQEYIQNAKTDNYDNVEDRLSEDTKYKKDYEKLSEGKIEKADFDKKYGRNAARDAQEHHKLNEKAEKTSFDQASYAARIANEYSKSEFRDEKKMTSLQKSMVNEYMQQTNSSKEYATRIVNNSITDAAKIRGVDNPNIAGARPVDRQTRGTRRTSTPNTPTTPNN